MSMSTHVVGFHPPDEKWKKMKAVWDACKAAGVGAPLDVERFFNGEAPDDAGVETSLDNYQKPHPACTSYMAPGKSGYEIDLSKLPTNITKIRFYNSW